MNTFRARFWPAIFLLLVPIMPLWRAVFLGEAIGPFDQIRQFAPWNAPPPNRPWEVLQADGVLQFYGWRDLVLAAWGHQQLPLWDPYALAGTPLLANSQSAAFYPPHIVLGLLHLPTALAMLLLAWVHLSWAGLGTYRIVRRLGGSRLGGTVAGASFTLSPFMLAWTALPSVITTVSWIPWMLVCVAGLFVLKSHGRRSIIGLAASTAMLILSGHLQFVAYGILAALLFAIGMAVAAWTKGRARETVVESSEPADAPPGVGAALLRPWLGLVCGGILGLCLAAPQLLPVLDYSQFSHRRGAPSEEGYHAYVANAIQPYELGTLPFAPLTGDPSEFTSADIHGPNGSRLSAYFPQYVRPGDNFAESAASTGLLVLTLVFLAPWRRRWRDLVPIAVVGGLALLLALGTPLNRLLYFGVPGWSASGSPGRIVVLFVLAACVIAGIALDDPPKLPTKGLVRFAPFLLPVFLAEAGCWLVLQYPFNEANAAPFSVLANAAVRDGGGRLLGPALIAVMVALSLAYVRRNRLAEAETLAQLSVPQVRQIRWSGILLLLMPVLIAFTAWSYELIPTGDPSYLAISPLAGTDPNARVAVVNEAWSLTGAAPAIYPPNTPSVARIHDLSGYDSLIHRDTVAMLTEVDGQPPPPGANGNIMFVKPSANPDRLAAAGVTEVWTRREMPQLGTPFATDHEVLRYRVAGPGRASAPVGPAMIVRETASQITLRATGPGRLVLRDRNMPGWTAKVDGRHVPLLGTTWREVDLSSGAHEIEFNYVPPGFMMGSGLAFFGLVGIAVVASLFRRVRA